MGLNLRTVRSRRSRGESQHILALLVILAVSCASLFGCSDERGQSSVFGTFSEDAATYERSLDDVQVDWWPKADDGVLNADKTSVAFNRNSRNSSVLGGDERQFLSIAEISGNSPQDYKRIVTVRPGKEYRGVAYFRNGSSENESVQTRMSISLPTHVLRRTPIVARLASANSRPAEVGSQGVLTTNIGDPAVFLTMESAWVSIQGKGRTYEVDPTQLTSARGADIGCKNSDGNLPSGDDCWGAVIFTFKAVKMSYYYTMYVAHDQDTRYSNSITYSRGESRISVGLSVENSGHQTLRGVILTIPQFNEGSPVVLDMSTVQLKRDDQPWYAVNADDKGSVQVGDIDPGKKATLSVRAIIKSDISGVLCSRGSIPITGQVNSKDFVASKASAQIFVDNSDCK